MNKKVEEALGVVQPTPTITPIEEASSIEVTTL